MTLVPAGLRLLGLSQCLRRGPRTAPLVIYMIGAVAGLYTHATMLILVVACNVAALAWIVSTSGLRWRSEAVRWILANIIVAALAVPEAVGALHIIAAHGYAPGRPVLPRYLWADVFSAPLAGPANSPSPRPRNRCPDVSRSCLRAADIPGVPTKFRCPRRHSMCVLCWCFRTNAWPVRPRTYGRSI